MKRGRLLMGRILYSEATKCVTNELPKKLALHVSSGLGCVRHPLPLDSLMDPTLLQSKFFLILCAAVVVIAGVGLINTIVAFRWQRRGKDIGSKLKFKYVYPLAIKPEGEYPFLLFISTLETGYPTSDKRPNVIEETIRRQVERLLDLNSSYYFQEGAKSTRRVQKKTHLKFKIEAKGLTFDPVGTTRLHRDELVIQHFQVSADKSMEGKTVRAVFKVSSGWLKVAEFGFEIEVTSKAPCEPFKAITAPIRRDIFPSYAREDAAYLEEFKKYFKVFGDEYISDQIIRAGTLWEQEIKALINRADLFQLFWTRNAAESKYIQIELKYALSLNRPGFIYQTVCEDDAPPPPVQGSDIQIAYVSLTREKEKTDSNRKAFLFAPIMAASGSTANAAVPVLTAVGGVMALSVAIGLGAHWGIERATRSGPGPGPGPTPASTSEPPSPSPSLSRSPTPPLVAPVSGQVLVSNEGKAGVEVKLCSERSPSSKPACTSTKTGERGAFSFPTVDKALKYYVIVPNKDWTCDPQRQPISDVSIPQNIRFACKPSQTETPWVNTYAEVGIKVDAEGQVTPVVIKITNLSGQALKNIRVRVLFPEFVDEVLSTPQFKASRKKDRRPLTREFRVPDLLAEEEKRWELTVKLNRNLTDDERRWRPSVSVLHDK